jgi:YVTN family beta-propeller protein
MTPRFLFAAALVFLASSAAGSAAPSSAAAGRPGPPPAKVEVVTVDFLAPAALAVNGAGPVLVRMDAFRNRLVAANTLTSSVSIIDCARGTVRNVPTGGRALQHLKAEAMTLRRKTGDVCLIGARCFSVVSAEAGTSTTVATGPQFESIAVDEATGNVFLAGRESRELGFYDARAGKLSALPWLETREDLVNLNATPPPPIRKVVAAPELGWIVGVDGFTSTFYIFDGRTGKTLNSRHVALTAGGRWHLAGYNEASHSLYLVVETNDRRVIEAAKLDVLTGEGTIVRLPEFTEGVGIVYNPARDEVYIPYDNHASVHVVDFREHGRITEIKIPAYGNDASAIDETNGILYVASWAHGEVDVVDLADQRLVKRITGLGIIPHMFAMAFNPNDGLLYYPKGATAVNGTFGAAVTVLDPAKQETRKIRLGWAPIDLVEVPSRHGFLVFDSEDELADVHEDGRFETRRLPFDYPVSAALDPEGNVYLSYGPHQSYWPVVYIWGAKDGILGIDARNLRFYDRRIPRQAHAMAFDTAGTLYFTQNIWGKEEQMLGTLPDEIRLFEIGTRITIPDTIERENSQKILRSDPVENRLYLLRVAEKDEDPSVLHVIDPAAKKDLRGIAVGRTAADLAFDERSIYVANFDSRSVSVVDKGTFAVREVPTGAGPLKLCALAGDVWVMNNLDRSIQRVKAGAAVYRVPGEGRPDNIFPWNGALVVTSHSAKALEVYGFDPAAGRFTLLHRFEYPYGDTRFDSGNAAFYLRGQFGDAVFSLTNGRTAEDGRLWITDFLSGKLFILASR